MLFRLIRILLIAVTLSAATPKPFAAVGDPLYRSVDALKHLAGLHAFKPHAEEFDTLAAATEAAKQEGFALEKRRDKEAADRYIARLRQLEKHHRHAAHLIKKIQLKVIAEDRSQRFRRIMGSEHPILSQDPTLRREISYYEKRLKRRLQAEAAERQAYYKTAAHLNGLWASERQRWIFADKRLSIVTVSKGKTRILEGSWAVRKQHLHFHIDTITNRHHKKSPHTRKTSVKRSYRLHFIGEEQIKALTPDRRQLTLLRKQ